MVLNYSLELGLRENFILYQSLQESPSFTSNYLLNRLRNTDPNLIKKIRYLIGFPGIGRDFVKLVLAANVEKERFF